MQEAEVECAKRLSVNAEIGNRDSNAEDAHWSANKKRKEQPYGLKALRQEEIECK